MSDAVNITNAVSVDKDKFISAYKDAVSDELLKLLDGVQDKQDKETLEDILLKMVALYQGMYFASTEKERKSIQRMLNNYKSSVAAISARYKLDFANQIIKITKKASVIALSVAVNFVAL